MICFSMAINSKDQSVLSMVWSISCVSSPSALRFCSVDTIDSVHNFTVVTNDLITKLCVISNLLAH